MTAALPVPKLTGMLHNEDCTNLFAHQRFPDGKAGEMVDRYVDVIADSGVDILVCNTSSRRTNYRSDVWEAFWDGYDSDGPDDQAFFAGVPEEQRASYRQLIANMLATHNEGVDYPARVVERCRHHGISPWISLRMNDVHANGNLDHPMHSDFWRNARFFRKGHPGYYARALDYAHAEVRDHYRALIVETLDRYDIDGLELDFMREPYLFSKGGGLEVNYQPYLGIPNRIVTKEEAVGAAVGVWASGADTVYLFNNFQTHHPRWSIPEYHRMLRAFSSYEELQKLPRRHAVTFEDVTLPGEKYPSLLPAVGDDFDFAMQLGPAPPANWQG